MDLAGGRKMKTISTRQELRIRAAEALRAVLAEVSGAKVREISHPSPEAGSADAFTASVDVYGRRHTLACEIAPDDQPAHLSLLLRGLRSTIESAHTPATPVIIAPHISDEARDLCRRSKAGFLDLEGNARLALGEVFILKRTIPHEEKRAAARHDSRPAAQHTAA
jgi:hypothetical protein